MAAKTQEQLDQDARALAESNQTEEERARQEFERGPNSNANRANEDIARGMAIGAAQGAGAPPATEDAAPPVVNQQPALSSDNVMYTIALPHQSMPVGPPILPHPTKIVIDNMGVALPPMPKGTDPKTVFLVGGKYVNFEGVPIDQVTEKPVLQRLSDRDAQIVDLQRQIAEMKAQ